MTASLIRRSAPVQFFSTILISVVASLVLAAPSQAATRTWVSGVGDDANPCSRTAPCKTFAGAISKTDAGGTISVLDPGGFGSVTITKAITIDGAGVAGSILNTSVNGITINAGATDSVIIRGIAITGGAPILPTACPFGGTNGIRILKAHAVLIENTTIDDQLGAAVLIAPTTTSATVALNNVHLRNTCGEGINASPTGGAAVQLNVRDSTITNTATGLLAASGAHARVSTTTIFGNTLGLSALGTGIIESNINNQIFGNTTDGEATSSFGAPLLVWVIDERARVIRARRAFKLRYFSTDVARATLIVKRGAARVATVTGRAANGNNTITWNGRISGKFAARGKYTLTVRAVSIDGQVVTTAPLALRIR